MSGLLLIMPTFEPKDPNFATRVRASFARQKLMKIIGAEMTSVSPGAVEITLPFRDDLTQQHGFLHGGIVASIGDSACGYAALTLTPKDAAVLAIEYKINFASTASKGPIVARGRVTKPGRNVTVCAGDVFILSEDEEKLVATMLSTIMTLRDREDLRD